MIPKIIKFLFFIKIYHLILTLSFSVIYNLTGMLNIVNGECCYQMRMRGCATNDQPPTNPHHQYHNLSNYIIFACLDCFQPGGDNWQQQQPNGPRWYCGIGDCNLFGCNCNGGCRKSRKPSDHKKQQQQFEDY